MRFMNCWWYLAVIFLLLGTISAQKEETTTIDEDKDYPIIRAPMRCPEGRVLVRGQCRPNAG